MIDQARQNRRWKIEKTKKAFEVALPAAGIAFMFSDKRRIELTRADLAKDVTILLAATDNGLEPTPALLPNEATAAPVLTLFRKALEAEQAA